MVRGRYSGFYPYPFLNVNIIGLKQSIINILIILVLSLFLMGILILAGRTLKPKRQIH
ncbi:Pr6Pr family membrane protein [Aestuariivivens insulae]|uniref:Pr6Pr family membrane protein n=1 Tax=Aestuariivivens insulae TaxID=1621988 RepID=UPI00374D3918